MNWYLIETKDYGDSYQTRLHADTAKDAYTEARGILSHLTKKERSQQSSWISYTCEDEDGVLMESDKMYDMDNTVLNDGDELISYNAAVALMDDEIMSELDGMYDDIQAYFAAYCLEHKDKFGSEFEPNKANGVY